MEQDKKDRLKKWIINLIKNLEEACYNFKSFCHDKDCKYKNQCPMQHLPCLLNLNTETAMLWELAYQINRFKSKSVNLLMDLDRNSFKFVPSSFKFYLEELSTMSSEIHLILSIADHHMSEKPIYETLSNFRDDFCLSSFDVRQSIPRR